MHLFWLSDDAWLAIEPHLPRGKPGKPRVDNRRVISGILHVLKPGYPICVTSHDVEPEEGGDQARIRSRSLPDGLRRGRKPFNWPATFGRGRILPSSGRTSPVTSTASRGAGAAVDHVDTVAAGGPRRPLIRPIIPANTARGRAASAIWKMA